MNTGPDYFAIPRVCVVFRPPAGPSDFLDTESSRVLFARLRQASQDREEVSHMAIEGRDVSDDSIAALNSWLRAGRAMGQALHHPWDRLPHRARDTKYEWRELSRHLALTLTAEARK